VTWFNWRSCPFKVRSNWRTRPWTCWSR